MISLDLRMPLPIIIASRGGIRLSIRIGQSAGSPIGVIAPNSILVSATASSIGANEIFLVSTYLRTTPFTSKRLVASTIQATYQERPSLFAFKMTQLADLS